MTTQLFDLHERSGRIFLETQDRKHSFKNSKGFGYLLELLRNPGKQFSAMTLYNSQNLIPPQYRHLAEQTNKERLKQLIYSYDELPPVRKADWQTVREVSKRLNFLIEQKALMLEYNDLSTLEEVEWEMDFLTRYLTDVLRREGSLAAFSDAEKRVIRAVNRAIRRTIKQIETKEPDLGEYLNRQVYAWRQLSYLPTEEYEWGAVH